MNRSRPIAFLVSAAVLLPAALSVVACGGGSGAASTSSTAAKTASGRPATLGVSDSDLGKILVDSQGRTLYLFQKDAGTKSACTGACATAWPPLRATGKPTVGTGANAALVATTPRSDGRPQVIYNEHPVYRYQGDKNPGDTNGQGLTAFGGSWFALSPGGDQVTSRPTNSGGGY